MTWRRKLLGLAGGWAAGGAGIEGGAPLERAAPDKGLVVDSIGGIAALADTRFTRA